MDERVCAVLGHGWLVLRHGRINDCLFLFATNVSRIASKGWNVSEACRWPDRGSIHLF